MCAPKITKGSEELIRAQEQSVRSWEELIGGAETNIPLFARFIGDVFLRLEDYASSKAGQTLDSVQKDLKDEEFRNAVYRDALEERAWLFGYDIRIIAKMGAQIARDNARRMSLYNSLDEDARGLVAQGYFTMIFPQPLGADKVEGRKLHEKILPEMLKKESPESFAALEEVVESYCDRRAAEIMAV